ncbi:MAG: LysR family transcriptional regulator [Paracoccaceae bacterium]|nr:LysR family transcriptional regulator [Paracoccaceae bacterium]
MYSLLSWDDMCLVHAIAEVGTLSGAARTLDVSHPTAFRRLNRLEQKMGVRFFDRSRDGYTATTAADEVAALVQRLRNDVLAVERRIAGQDLRPSGTLRITTTDTLLFGWLSPGLLEFRRAYPDVRLELVVSNDVFNLSRREADIAVRPAHRPDENLVGRRVGTIEQAVYVATALAARANDVESMTTIDWIGPDESMAYPAFDRWLEQEGLVDRCRIRLNTVYGMLSAVRAGLGLSVLPCYLGEDDAQVTRVGGTIPSMATDLWILTHSDLRRTERIRIFLDHVAGLAKTSHFGPVE